MYAYLVFSLIFGIIWLILYLRRKDLRYEMLFVSVLFLPFGLTQALFAPQYWEPDVVYRFFGLFDIESLLHTFFIGGIAASLYEELFNYHLRKTKKPITPRYHAYVVYGAFLVCTAVMIFAFITEMFTVFWAWLGFTLLATPYFLIVRRDLARFSLLSGVSFMLLYFAVLWVTDFLFNDFIESAWNLEQMLGIFIFSIPLEEYIYSFVLGMVFSVVYEEIKNLKVVRYRTQEKSF